jgi:hypothetical protein
MIPAARQRVRVEGGTGLYFVLAVNHEYGYAELLDLDSLTLLDGVLFERILPVRPEMDEDEMEQHGSRKSVDATGTLGD